MTITDDAMAFLVEACDGDARRALTALEIGVKSAMAPELANPDREGGGGTQTPTAASTSHPLPHGRGSPVLFDLALAQDSIQRKVIEFDPTGDTHYDVASAFIKSLRGSDPDAALYWCARMLEGGEDPRFVARRLVIFASEDIGNADPFAVVLANAAWDAVERVGMPECRINLGHAVCYLATCQKSNAAYMGIEAALKDVREGRTLPVPRHLRDGNHKGAKAAFGHVGYKYAHDYEGGWVDQEYVPTDAEYYQPTDRGHEAKIKARLDELRKRKKAKPGEPGGVSPRWRRGGATMTEEEWLTGEDLAALLGWATVHKRRRKLRLFSCACARCLEPWFKNPRLLKALDASERYADGLIKDAGIAHWNRETNEAWRAVVRSRVRDKQSKLAAHRAVAYACMAEKYGGYQNVAARVLQEQRAFGDETRVETAEAVPDTSPRHLRQPVPSGRVRPGVAN